MAEEQEKEPKGVGALAGMIAGGAAGLPFGPSGIIIGGIAGAVIINELEREWRK